ncbi:DNA helicase [Tanacetum coccineum]
MVLVNVCDLWKRAIVTVINYVTIAVVYPGMVNGLQDNHMRGGQSVIYAVEEDRMDYVSTHQNDIRSDHLSGFYDAFGRGDLFGIASCSKIILPSSFTVLYTIEFQKRGLPHCHTLLWVDPKDKIETAELSVELPNPQEDPSEHRLLKPGLDEEEQRRSQEFADWLLHVGDGELRKPDEEDADDTCWLDILAHFCVTPDKKAIPAGRDTSKIEMLYPPEYLNTIKFPGFSPHELYLKVGSPMMLLRNVNLSGGLCNGTRMIVRSLSAVHDFDAIVDQKCQEPSWLP